MDNQEKIEPIVVEEFIDPEKNETVIVEKAGSKSTVMSIVALALALLGAGLYVLVQFVIPACTTLLSIVLLPLTVIFVYVGAIISVLLMCIPVVGWAILLIPTMIDIFVKFIAFALVVGGVVVGIMALKAASKSGEDKILEKVLAVSAAVIGGLVAIVIVAIATWNLIVAIIGIALVILYILFCLVMGLLPVLLGV